MGTKKPTKVDIDALKSALDDLTALQSQMTGGAAQRLTDAADITGDLGPLLNGTGMQMASYYRAHASAIQGAVQKTELGVAAAMQMLQLAITHHETADQRNAAAANGTAAGGVTSARPAV